jgi:hypothetical protein
MSTPNASADIRRIPNGREARIAPSSALGNGKWRFACARNGRASLIGFSEAAKRADLSASRRTPPVFADRIRFLRPHAGTGGARSRAISVRISANIRRDTATSAIWNVT